MSIISLLQKKNIIYIVVFGISLILSSCNFLDLLPNKERDKWYMEHSVDLSKLYAVHEGGTRKEVLEKWGEPWRIKSEDHWIYFFPELAKEKIHLQFKNDVVIKMWTSFEIW